jgi:hypothetical protein
VRPGVEGGVEAGIGAHREDGAAAYVHRDEAAGQPPVTQRLLSHPLEPGVQREPQVVAGPRRAAPEHPLGTAERVDLDPLAAGDPAQEAVVAVLHTGLADDVAGSDAAIGGPLQLTWAHLPDDPEDVSGEGAGLVAADVGALDADAGEPLLVLEQVEEQAAVDALLQNDRIARVLRSGADPLADLPLGEPQEVTEPSQLGAALISIARQIGGAQLEGHHRAIGDQELAVAVENLAAGRVHPHVEDAVVLGERAVVLAVQHLQGPEPEQDRRDRGDDHGADDRDAQVEPIGQPRRDVLGAI